MADKLEELPLFPVDAVLFPYAALQIHVSEGRYKDMIQRCLDEGKSFGIVLIREGNPVEGMAEPYMVGTAVRILQVHVYEDGHLDVQVQGERRFRIRRLDETRDYPVGYVEPVIELEIEPGDETEHVIARARESFRHFVENLFPSQEFKVQVRFPSDPVALSFTIANLLELGNLEKQRLLELTDTIERLHGLTPILEKSMLEARTPAYYRLRAADLREWIHMN